MVMDGTCRKHDYLYGKFASCTCPQGLVEDAFESLDDSLAKEKLRFYLSERYPRYYKE